MVQPVNHDPITLGRRSLPASPEDASTGQDLLDTLQAHEAECVGMAANIIGVHKRIIAVNDEGTYRLMYNPEIIKKSGNYETEEGCLSLPGVRKTVRWKTIKVRFLNENFSLRIKTFTGFTAQIIQHEIDHCDGVLI